MPTEPEFVSKEIGAIEKTPQARKPRAAKRRGDLISGGSFENNGRIGKDKKKEIDKQITAIYEDGDGKIPNMKKIDLRKSRPWMSALVGLVTIVLLATGGWLVYDRLFGGGALSDNKISFEIIGPSETAVGATTTYTISYRNNLKTAAKNCLLTINYPEGFVFAESSPSPSGGGRNEWSLGELAPKAEGEIQIIGRTLGDLEQEASWRAFFNYQPDNFNSEMQEIATLKTKIASSPVSISIGGPDKKTVGEEAEYVFTLKNEGDWQPEKLELAPSWPANFFLTSSSPALAKNNRWIIKMTATSTATSSPANLVFKIRGKLGDNASSTAENEIKISANVFLPPTDGLKSYRLASGEIKTELTKNECELRLAVNGSMTDFGSRPGETLNITLNAKNAGKDTMRRAVIRLTLDAPALKKQSALNWPEIDDPLDGTIIGSQLSETRRRGQISWNSAQLATLKEIKAGQEISIDLRLPIRGAETFDLAELTEYAVSLLPEIEYTDTAGKTRSFAGNPINITLNSDLTFEKRDDNLGGVPPQREITWLLGNSFHPLKNLELSASILGRVSFESPTPTPAGEVTFDADTQKVTWKISEMPEGVDVLALPFTVTILKENPTQNLLISKVHVRAEDAITGQMLDFMGDETAL